MPIAAQSPADFEDSFAAMTKARVQAVLVAGSALANTHWARLLDHASRNRLPMIFLNKDPVLAGGLISYGMNNSEMFRRAADFVDKILKGAKPGDLPFEQPTKFELVVNLKTAKALGIKIPPSILLRADRVVIE